MINVLEYKGYKASIKFDEEDQIIDSRVLDIEDITIFHGESVTQFENAFHQSINSYMRDCRD